MYPWKSGTDATTQRMHDHHSHDVVLTRDGNGKLSKVEEFLDTEAGTLRIESVISRDVEGNISSIREKVFDTDGVTPLTDAIFTIVRTGGKLTKVQVRPQ